MEHKIILYYEKCRLCLNKVGVQNIFEDEDIADSIYLFTRIKVSCCDKLPQKICTDCLTIIKNAKELRELAIKNESILLSLFNAEFDCSDEIRYKQQGHGVPDTDTKILVKKECTIEFTKSEDTTEDNLHQTDIVPSHSDSYIPVKNEHKTECTEYRDIIKKTDENSIENSEENGIAVRKDLFDSYTVSSSTGIDGDIQIPASEPNTSKRQVRREPVIFNNDRYRCNVPEIIALYQQNITISEIARRLKLSRKTIRLWVQRYVNLGHVYRCKPGPRPTAFTDETPLHRAIVAIHAADPFAKVETTATTFGVSPQTVRKHLRADGFSCQKLSRNIVLSDTDRKNRILFAEKYLDFDWLNNVVIFADEKYFRSEDGGKLFWRKKGVRRFSRVNILQFKTSSPITAGYWGWMSSMGPGELVKVEARNNNQDFLDILKNVMLPTVRIAYPNEHIYFVPDNCGVNKAHVLKDWLRSQTDVTIIDWPDQSPDINPMEILWDHMVLSWDPSQECSSFNFDDVITSSWESLRGSDLCWNMFRNMRRRLQILIENQGGIVLN